MSYFFQNDSCSRFKAINTLKSSKSVIISFTYPRLWTWPKMNVCFSAECVSYVKTQIIVQPSTILSFYRLCDVLFWFLIICEGPDYLQHEQLVCAISFKHRYVFFYSFQQLVRSGTVHLSQPSRKDRKKVRIL